MYKPKSIFNMKFSYFKMYFMNNNIREIFFTYLIKLKIIIKEILI